MSFIGEAIATAAIDVLFMKLTSTKLLQFARRENIHADLKKWEEKLRKIKAVLNDAAERQLEDRSVRDWLTDLKNLAYDVEDILDEFATEALKRELLDEPHASTSKVRKLIRSCFTALSPPSIKFNFKMASQIKKITDRLEEIVENKISLKLKEIQGEKSSKVKYQSSRESTSLPDPYICGRENDKKAILDMLFKDEGTSTSVGVPVISIFGMGGLGKTTLAQLVYNDKEVDTCFDFKAWAYVSEDFDIAQVTKIVLQSIASGTGDGNNLNLLQFQLKEKLAGKKFLIVLDDFWHDNYEDWTKFCLPFQAGSFGSKIIITTRKESVASMAEVNNGSIHRLKQLSNDNCLSLFTFHALGKTDFNEHPDLKEIGEKIVDRCKGLPLAAKTLGGHLGSKFGNTLRNKYWEDLLDSRIWNLSAEKGGILPALRVSYSYLSPPLRRCFAYCSIFPKGYKFEKKEIILLWMAEGFLQTDRDEKQAEDIGDEFFENLFSISFFQQSRSIYFPGFVMHDLIHDLAQWAAEDFCLKVENVSEDEKKLKTSKNLHHLSFVNVGAICECIKKLEASDEVIKSIRTFLPLLPEFASRTCDFLNLLPRLQRLRVLSLKGYRIEDLPNTISDLKHLRYLDLSNTAIKKLPDSINTLYNLEILKLETRDYLPGVNLCSDMGNLINLRHLYNSKPSSMERMPSGIGRLIHLRTFPFYLVGKDVGFGLKELKKLTHLQDEFCISGLENVNVIGDAKDIIGKKKLRELELEWTSSFSDSRDIGIETQVLDMLQPYNKLEKLTIKSYGGTKFPSWLAGTSLPKLVLLRFEDCKNCTSLPPIGQLPLLKDLYIEGLAGIESISPEFYGNGRSKPFQSLEFLHIEDMQEWKDWNHLGFGKDNVGFPRLRELSIVRCPKLSRNLPEHLPLLERLFIHSCEQLWMSIPDPEDGFPTNRTSLEWELHRFTSLKHLIISDACPDMISIPMLPTSLTTLHIYDFRDLERLSPNFQDLSSLNELHLQSCPNLKFFPEKGLPSSLQTLSINECPLLKQRCEKDKGLYWPMIARVPEVYIDDQPKKMVLKLNIHDERAKEKALKTVSSISGVHSIQMDMKDRKLTVIGYMDPIVTIKKLRKLCYAECLSIGPANKLETLSGLRQRMM